MGIVAYDKPQTGRTYLLVINKAIYLDRLEHHLLWPMKYHMNQVNINGVPKFLENPDKYTRDIQVSYPLD